MICHMQAIFKGYRKSSWTFPFKYHTSFKKFPPKVAEPRTKAKANMLQNLGCEVIKLMEC